MGCTPCTWSSALPATIFFFILFMRSAFPCRLHICSRYDTHLMVIASALSPRPYSLRRRSLFLCHLCGIPASAERCDNASFWTPSPLTVWLNTFGHLSVLHLPVAGSSFCIFSLSPFGFSCAGDPAFVRCTPSLAFEPWRPYIQHSSHLLPAPVSVRSLPSVLVLV